MLPARRCTAALPSEGDNHRTPITQGPGLARETAARGVYPWVLKSPGRAHGAVGEGCGMLAQFRELPTTPAHHRQQRRRVSGETGVPSNTGTRSLAASDCAAHDWAGGGRLQTIA